MIDRRPIIQKYLDQIEPGSVIVKPMGPEDIDDLCIFQKPAEYKQSTASLPIKWFDDGRYDLIGREISRAILRSVVK